MEENRIYKIFKRITRHIAKYSAIIFAVSVVFSVIYLIIDAIDKDYESGFYKPFRQTYCLNDTEYILQDITQEEFVLKLEELITADSAACYAIAQTGVVDTMTVNASFLGDNNARDQGPLCYTVVFFVPFNSKQHANLKLLNDFSMNDDNFNQYPGKYRLILKIIDTEPLRLILPRGVGFGYSQDIKYVNKYVRDNYLNKICKYDRQPFKNFVFTSIGWAFIAIHYTFSLLAISVIWVLTWLVFDFFWKIISIIKEGH